MNKTEKQYLSRWLTSKLHSVVRDARVTVLTGARQVGKSTLLAHELTDAWTFYSLDDLDIQRQAKRDPELLLNSSNNIVLDEAHTVPELFPVIKRLSDADRSRRFVLSGSANLLLLSRTTESLAGRAEFLHLSSLSAGELAKRPPPAWLAAAVDGQLDMSDNETLCRNPVDWAQAVWRGGMPEILYRPDRASLLRWRDGYLHSYLERDLRQLSQVDNLADFKRLMSLAALRCGQLLNQSEIARDAGLSQPTAHRYLALLEVSEQCTRLPPFFTNLSKSVVKTPKLMWADTGISAFCAGFYSPSDLKESREWGGVLESYVYNQIRAICGTWDVPAEILFWRTRSGLEVDFVIRRGRDLLAIEVKAGTQVRFDDTVALQQFMKVHSDCRMGIVLYGGNEARQISERLAAIPLAWLL